MLTRRSLVGAIVAASAMSEGPAFAQSATLRSADIHPDGYPTVEAVKHFGSLLTERTKGRLKVQVFHSAQLGQERETIEQTRFGVIDLNRINMGPFNNLIPETFVPALPFIFRSVDHMRKTMDGAIGDQILKSFEPHGLVALAFYDSGARSFYNSKRPITTLADMKGMKVRVIQSDLFIDLVNALGANATPMPPGEVYSALQTGIVDGAENNWPSYESSRHFEAAKFYNVTEHSMVPEVLVFSKKIFDGLSKDEQAMIRKTAKESVPYMRKLWDERETKSRKTAEAGGAQVIAVADKKPWIDAMAPVYAKFADTPKLKELVKRIQDAK